MKKTLLLSCTILLVITAGCVQKTHKRTVTFTLDVSGMENIKSVGIRGWDNPLTWEKDHPLKEIVKDSLYQATITGETGRICTEFKFTVNEKMELEGDENRKIYFDTTKDTTKALFVFNKKL